jgi:hypothetical protein
VVTDAAGARRLAAALADCCRVEPLVERRPSGPAAAGPAAAEGGPAGPAR